MKTNVKHGSKYIFMPIVPRELAHESCNVKDEAHVVRLAQHIVNSLFEQVSQSEFGYYKMYVDSAIGFAAREIERQAAKKRK